MGLFDVPQANLRSLGGFLTSMGSAFNLPEMNVGERLGVTGNWGEKLVPKVQAADSVPQNPAEQGSSAQSMTGYIGNQGNPVASGTGNPTTGGPTGGTNTPPMGQPTGGGGIDYDALIAPALAKLQESMGGFQSAYNENVSGIESSGKLQEEQARNIGIEGERTATSAKKTQKGITESAVDEARRQYSEISQGMQARYGGTTGTGKFANEIVGSSAMAGIGKMRINLANAIQSIDDKLMEVKTLSEMQVKEVQQKVTDLKVQARNQLEANLAQIRNAQGAMMADKVKYASDAMNFYREQVAQVNRDNTEFMRNLYLQQQAAEQKLTAAKQTASSKQAELMNLGTSDVPNWSWVNQGQQTITPATVGGAGKLTGYGEDELDKQIYR